MPPLPAHLQGALSIAACLLLIAIGEAPGRVGKAGWRSEGNRRAYNAPRRPHCLRHDCRIPSSVTPLHGVKIRDGRIAQKYDSDRCKLFRAMVKGSDRERDKEVTIAARWCFDSRYGCKMEAIKMMNEWISEVGSEAGLLDENCRLLSAAIGPKESRIEMELDMYDMAELEAFWKAIPQDKHREWSKRMQPFIVDGSPEWQVFRKLPRRTFSQTDGGEYLASVNITTGEKKVIHDMNGKPIELKPGDSIPDLAPEGSVTFGNLTFIMPENFEPYQPPSIDEVLPSEKLSSPLFDEPDLDDDDFFPKPRI